MKPMFDPFVLRELASRLAAVANRLDSREAARHCAQAAAALNQAMSRTTNPAGLRILAEGLSAAAGHLEARDAAQAADALTQAMENAIDPSSLPELAWALWVVASRLEGQEAARHSALAADAFTRVLSKTPDALYLSRVVRGLAVRGVQLKPKDTTEAIDFFVDTMCETIHLDDLNQLAPGLSATLTGDPRHPATRAVGIVACVGVVVPGQPLLAPAMHLSAMESLPCRLSTQQLVDLLKKPLCVGPARRVVLEQLENRYRRPFADHWEFVRFARAQKLGLDFTTPPRLLRTPAPRWILPPKWIPPPGWTSPPRRGAWNRPRPTPVSERPRPEVLHIKRLPPAISAGGIGRGNAHSCGSPASPSSSAPCC
jgi:hypothetical protein